MSGKHFDRFNSFCNNFSLSYIEQGYFNGNSWCFDNIIAPFNRLYIILSGEGLIDIGQTSIPIKEGSAYLIPAGLNFSCQSPHHIEKLFCHFLAPDDTNRDIFYNCKNIMTLSIEDTPIPHSTVKALIADHQDMYYTIKAYYDCLVSRFIRMQSESHHTIRIPDQSVIIRQIMLILEQNLSGTLKIEWIADQIGMSPSALSKYYMKHMKRRLKDDITENLIKKGKIELLTTGRSIQQIAYSLGYNDSLYFSKVFKKHVDITPSDYRRQNQIYQRNPANLQ